MTAPHLPLAGIRVLELGNFIAAPTAGRLLADFGAEVIKVERPGHGDELRTWRLYEGSTSMLYRSINRNKKSVELDLRTADGRRSALALVSSCDVVLENFRPGTLERWGLSPAEFDVVRPGIVVVRISAYGQNGPMSSEPGFAAVAEAVGGLRALVGEPDRPPARTGVSIGDTLAGMYGAFGALVVLLQCARNPEEPVPPLAQRVVDVALNEAVLSVTESLVPDHLAYGIERRRTGGRVEGIAPSNAYRCLDGSMVVVAGNGDAIFGRFMEAIDRPEFADDPAMVDNSSRWEHRDRLDDAIEQWTSQHSRDDVLAILAKAGVPAGPISTAADIVADPQYAHRDMIQYLAVETGLGTRCIGFPGVVPVIGDRSLPIRSLGPELGEHNDEILCDLMQRADE